MKVLAGPDLASLTYSPPPQEELGADPLAMLAENRNVDWLQTSPGNDGRREVEAVRAHEYRAVAMLQQRQPVAALAELEAALCLCEKRGLESVQEIRRRWQTLTASAVAWSLDFLADAGLQAAQAAERRVPGASVGSSSLAASDQALEMLCLAEMLTRQEVAENFGAHAMPSRLFLRALAHAGLGTYYQLRNKPRAAANFLEQAANGHARWVHPAVLLNLSAAHALLKQPGQALGVLGQAALAIRSATGRLCGEGLDEVDAAATAARAAVAAVLGPESLDEDTDGHAVTAMLELDPFGHGIDIGEDSQRHGRVTPGDLLETPQDTRSSFGGGGIPLRKVPPSSGGVKALRRGLGAHGLISKADTPHGQDIVQYEVEAAVARTLLVAKVLLWPWPEFREQEAVASGALAASNQSQSTVQGASEEKSSLRAHLSKLASPGIAQHATKLKKVWPQWGKPLQATEVPGAGLVMRECLLLCFLHAASALALLCSEPVYSLWVIPPLREGLALAIVLFGPKHPLALRLINACQRVQRPQACEEQLPAPPAPPSRPSTGSSCAPGRRRGVGQPTGASGARAEELRQAGRGRPPPIGQQTPSSRGRARLPSSARQGSASGRSKEGSLRPGSRGKKAPGPPAWNAGWGCNPVKADTLAGTPRSLGHLPKACDVPEGISKGVLHMQLLSPRASHGRERHSPSPVLRTRSQSSERDLRHLHMQAANEARRETTQAKSQMRQEMSRPFSATSTLSGGGLGRRLRARTAAGTVRPGGPPAAASVPTSPRSVSPGRKEVSPSRSREGSREAIWQIASRERAARPSSGHRASGASRNE